MHRSVFKVFERILIIFKNGEPNKLRLLMINSKKPQILTSTATADRATEASAAASAKLVKMLLEVNNFELKKL
jgi:hypothetical protein